MEQELKPEQQNMKVESTIAEQSKPVEVNNSSKKKLNKYQIISIVCVSVMLALLLATGIYFIVKNNRDKAGSKPLAQILTETNYNKIEVGQTYKQVTDIFGAGRRTSSEVTDQVTYIWETNNGKVLVITFTATRDKNNKIVAGTVIEKSQIGIISNAENA